MLRRGVLFRPGALLRFTSGEVESGGELPDDALDPPLEVAGEVVRREKRLPWP
jgi:hypothetical protein